MPLNPKKVKCVSSHGAQNSIAPSSGEITNYMHCLCECFRLLHATSGNPGQKELATVFHYGRSAWDHLWFIQ